MPASTPVLALPYPIPADTVDVPRDVLALATKLDNYSSLRPPVVTGLPGSPVDGQEIYFQADATNGVIWRLRYRAASASAYKWEFLGGGALHSVVPAQESFANTNWANLATFGPFVSLPLAGDYEIAFGATTQASAINVQTQMGVTTDVPGGLPTGYETVDMFSPQAVVSAPVTTMQRRKGISGTALCVYRVSSAIGFWQNRWIRAVPVRVG